MKNLLIEEMKRAIEIMEGRDEIKRVIRVEDTFPWMKSDREVVELFHILKMIRRHSTKLEEVSR
jgi:hypothetical protein